MPQWDNAKNNVWRLLPEILYLDLDPNFKTSESFFVFWVFFCRSIFIHLFVLNRLAIFLDLHIEFAFIFFLNSSIDFMCQN